MENERRQSSIDTLVLEIGALKEIASATNKSVSEVSHRVGIQNGRVGKLETRNAFIAGGLAILTILVLPIVFIVIQQVIIHLKF